MITQISFLDENGNKVTVNNSTTEATMIIFIGAAIIFLIIGLLLGAGIMCFVMRHRYKYTFHASAYGGPQHEPSKSQNDYVSLPIHA